MAEHVLVALTILGVGAWFGGFVTVFLVSRSSRTALAAAQRVALFREFGRRYLVVAACSMALILVPAAIITYMDPSNTAALVLLVASIVIVVVSVPAVGQARRMGALRRAALDAPDDADKAEAVHRSAQSATVLRAVLAVASISLVVLVLLL